MERFIDVLREWFSRNQDFVIRRGALVLGLLMVLTAVLYAVRIALRMGLF